MAAVAETRVFLEVRRRLQSALLILGEPKEAGLLMDISITPSSLQLKTPEGCTEIGLPAEVRLVPSSCRGLQYVPGDGLHLRLQAQAEVSTEPISMCNPSSQAQGCCTFYCQSCGEVIIRDSATASVEAVFSPNSTCCQLHLYSPFLGSPASDHFYTTECSQMQLAPLFRPFQDLPDLSSVRVDEIAKSCPGGSR